LADRKPNRLADETSAYLRQHMYNPVDWYPWGPEALERAQRENRPLLVSIGYSACHWCHVMEHESFEDEETAALMNERFVCIKVDREERPDVDQIYMDTVTGLTGHGGWPLTVFCTPDGRPFYGGTYYPPEPRQGMPSFRQLLLGIDEAVRERPDEVEQSAAQILAHLAKRPAGTAESPGAETLAQSAMRMLQRADPQHGGFGGAPKFPTPTTLDLLLAAIDTLPAHKAQEALDHVALTAHRMARGGLYDHVGGGFHRYTVDGHWCIPHFEKMLYDEGQLLRSYAETWRRSGGTAPDLEWPVRETIAFLEREMAAPDGGWFASQDADSEGEEGKFYVWTPPQIAELLGEERAEPFCAAYSITERGNFEHGTTHLYDVGGHPREQFAEERSALYTKRAERIAPGTDEKRVTSWNALTVSGLARAGSVFEEPAWIARAAEVADFLLGTLRDANGALLRIFNAGRAHTTGFLDDHATLLEACLDLYRAGAGIRFLDAARGLGGEITKRFFDAEERDLFLTPSDGERLAHRPRSDHDGAMPHSPGLATHGLLRLAALVEDGAAFRDVADVVLESHAFVLSRAPEAFPTLARAAAIAERGIGVAVVVGEDTSDTHVLAARARAVLAPEDGVIVTAGPCPPGIDPSWLLGREAQGGRATAYVCRGHTCSLPITDPAALTPDVVKETLA
jgi:uncharacterized protein YyaL (SSP411 family)